MKSSSSLVGLVASLIVSSMVVGCSGDESSATPGGEGASSGGSSGSSPQLASTGDCEKRCTANAEECGAGEEGARSCADLCKEELTTDQLACLEKKSCAEIGGASSIGKLCPKPASSSSSSGGSSSGGSSSGSSSGSSGQTGQPSALTVSASFGKVTATHVLASNGLSTTSTLTIAPKPSFSPAKPPTLPNLSKYSPAFTTPKLGACKATLNVLLNDSQISLSITGTDAGAARDCSLLTDEIASRGIDVFFSGVPAGAGTYDVTVKLKP